MQFYDVEEISSRIIQRLSVLAENKHRNGKASRDLTAEQWHFADVTNNARYCF